ncbi:MAG: pyruvoyl-dependent arginine decarboxylase, partial [Candidatus Korarchaeota archaeon]|nr:pyruvoyl-dependent arginine decarboxylase [Candidatus Korarchaeota archaeon]NIU82898.1 pyruvoyl-dependent arginine decarboxylase [Candidatus Thorarchaeota archaeon]NIW13347.1 pyruvoyl-dependent arginine decarboxylase [Candidatus Thorarchaeota archaeon]
MIPKYFFLTKGLGRHEKRLLSFEFALRNAGIQRFNLVNVSSIIPPNCERIPKEKGFKMLK